MRIAPAETVIIGNRIVITTSEWAKYRWMRQLVSLDCEKEELSSVLAKDVASFNSMLRERGLPGGLIVARPK